MAGADRPSEGFHRLPSFRLELLARLAERHADADFRRTFGLGILQCRLVGLVGSQGDTRFGEICRQTGIEKSHASRIVSSLIDLGLFEKYSDPSDQRSTIVRTTPAGKALHARMLSAAVARNRDWLQVLTPEQRDTFLACVDILTAQAQHLAQGSTRPAAASSDITETEPAGAPA